jgi:hypothetical protein
MAYVVLRMGDNPRDMRQGKFYILFMREEPKRYDLFRFEKDIKKLARDNSVNDVKTLLIRYLDWYREFYISNMRWISPFVFPSVYYEGKPWFFETFVLEFEKRYGRGFHAGLLDNYPNPENVRTWRELGDYVGIEDYVSEVDYVGEVEEYEDLYMQAGANLNQGYYVYFANRIEGDRVISGLHVQADMCTILNTLINGVEKNVNFGDPAQQVMDLLMLKVPFYAPRYQEGISIQHLAAGKYMLSQNANGLIFVNDPRNKDYSKGILKMGDRVMEGYLVDLKNAICPQA